MPWAWLCDLCPIVSKESILLHPLLYRVENSACWAVSVCWENNTRALFLRLWYVLLGNPPTNSRGCWEALSHTVAMEINRHTAISFLVFSLGHYPRDANYRVHLYTTISTWLCSYLFCVSFIRIRCISLTSCLAIMHRYPVNMTMLCPPLSSNLGQCHLSTTKCELCRTLLWRSSMLCRDLTSLHSSTAEGFSDFSQVFLFSVCVCSLSALFV